MDLRRGNHPLASVPGVLALAVWSIYLLLALKNLPDLPHRVLISGSFGLLASLAVIANFRYWRLAVLLASSVYLVIYAILATRMAMMVMDPEKGSLLSAFSFYYSTSWQVAAGTFQERGLVDGLAHGYLEYVMPVLNVALIGIVLVSLRRQPSVTQAG